MLSPHWLSNSKVWLYRLDLGGRVMVVHTVASQPEGLWFESRLQPVCAELACPSCARINQSKLIKGVNVSGRLAGNLFRCSLPLAACQLDPCDPRNRKLQLVFTSWYSITSTLTRLVSLFCIVLMSISNLVLIYRDAVTPTPPWSCRKRVKI